MSAEFVTNANELGPAFKQAMRRLAATVTIITIRTTAAEPIGMTATAVTSLSAEPMSLLACVNRSATIHSALEVQRPFCVNLLAQTHSDLSSTFGGKLSGAERFRFGQWQLDAIPYLADAQVNIACTVDALFEYGSHSIVVGRVDAIRLYGDFAPLIYGDGRFLQS